MKMKQHFAFLLAAVLAGSSIWTVLPVRAEGSGTSAALQDADMADIVETPSYQAYQASHKTADKAQTEIVLHAGNLSDGKDVSTQANYQGWNEEAVLTGETGYAEYKFHAEKAGLYTIGVDYFPMAGKGTQIIRTLKLDGKVPFTETRELTFQRIWSNGEAVTQDKKGNDIASSQMEAPRWVTMDLRDSAGYYADPLVFYLTAGEHTLRLESVREPMAIGTIRFQQVKSIPTYAQACQSYETAGYVTPSGVFKRVQGEDAVYKSDSMLYPSCDRSSPHTDPSDPTKIRLNIIGGEKWKTNSQWISWTVNVPVAGLYKLGFKARQNILNGAYSTRRLWVNGAVPFTEAEQIKFYYDNAWQMQTLQVDGKEALVYLKAGDNDLRLEVTLGDLSAILQQVNACISELNTNYRKILMVTGPNPDIDRDYQFHKQLPDVVKALGEQSRILGELFEQYKTITKQNGQQAQILNKLRMQTEQMSKNPRTIANRFKTFKTNIADLGTWIVTAMQQPLEIDYLEVASADQKISVDKGNIFEQIVYDFRTFIASFTSDYSSIGGSNTHGSDVRVWIGNGNTGGRDQAQLLRKLIDGSFSVKENVSVNLQLVSMNALMSATLAGKGPDVALTLNGSDPVNYAVRHAVEDLSQFPDCEEVLGRFMPSSVEPLKFGGGVYGLPETQVFYMMFYRKDILHELNLTPPKTWNNVVDMLSVLQKNQLSFALPIVISDVIGVGFNAYTMFLYQNGGELYEKDGVASALNQDAAIKAFSQWTRFYTDYSLPVQYDFLNRFRSGEIPIGIVEYTMYNQLSVFAPEINGLWEFCEVPGIEQADGSINNAIGSTVAASVILSQAQDKQAAWKFLKWWTSADVQAKFGVELESLMGPAGRYSPANTEALYQIPWTKSAFDKINSQWKMVKGMPEVPGGYYTNRYVDFAFRNVINRGDDPGEALEDAVVNINNEINNKRTEFGLQIKQAEGR